MNTLTNFFDSLMQKYLPDAFIFALLLTIIVFGAAVAVTPMSALEIVGFWGQGLDDLFKFAMEMTLILVSGFTLARSPFFVFLLDKLSANANSPVKAVLLATTVSIIACWFNWGFGLILAGLFAVELGRRVKDVNFALLVAASYSGFLVWHGGISGSVPLKLTSPSSEVQSILGMSKIGIEKTVFADFNLVLVFVTALTLLILNYIFARSVKTKTEFVMPKAEQKNESKDLSGTPALRLEQSKILNYIVVAIGFIYLGQQFSNGAGLNLNNLILLFIFLGMSFHMTPKNYLFQFSESVKDSAGIILQFPLYAGIMAIMRDSGLANMLSEFFVSISTKESFLMFTYWSAGIVNFFVPSGGGQWALQAPFILPAAIKLGIDPAKASMAIAWGDAWTNMVQPFWALPLLSVAKIPLRAIMGYCVMIFFVVGIVTSLSFWIISL